MRATKEVNVKNTNHGITLIALIITIIVMLILVAVTITMAVNGGLFGQAADAGKKTNEVVALEQELGKGVIKIKKGTTIYEYDNVDAYLSNTPSKVYEDGENKGENDPTENNQFSLECPVCVKLNEYEEVWSCGSCKNVVLPKYRVEEGCDGCSWRDESLYTTEDTYKPIFGCPEHGLELALLYGCYEVCSSCRWRVL